ncbi:NADH-quinone oxidoreductase subunit NuoG [Thiosulfativibrio zosterae]|uniref:NADH-quinone oxidoreductase n=1 Tax=Thiosulfativibrio zosterae TaxID=2675053 RepID=A0A6F8PPD6_9GAMM|nr:NADH-quinone oxidoreductase subunit NuoG [Thiosulfativibrio zosterae]BBP43936.1 NADH-quinone oxidoreductase [Thiosulfativibrio zosterae]
MVKIEINGQVVEAHEGDMLIDVADQAQISIPRFCYHKKLSIAGNCRMCLVEVEGAWKPLPACATPVTDGMKVHTKSAKAIAAQKSVMEFLLINHPLDCPICDQGGECELQDVAMDYGDDVSRYSEPKRILGDRNVGSLIQTDMTRCIHCTRCVRFGQEIAGMMELGATGRSEFMQIGTFIEGAIVSELSGNMIDICPVGSLTSKPFRYTARSWELTAHKSIAPHDSVGSNIIVHCKNGEVKRVVPDENEAINEVWISDRDRFSYEAINSESRLKQPMIKKNGVWSEVDWETALAFTVDKLNTVADKSEIGVLASPNSTLEELALLKKFTNTLGTKNTETRLKQVDFSMDSLGFFTPKLNHTFPEVEQLKSVLLVGSYLRKELPLLNHRVRKAQLNGAQVFTINPEKFDVNFDLKHELFAQDYIGLLAQVAKSAANAAKNDQAWLNSVTVSAESDAIAAHLKANAAKASIMVGQIASSDLQYGLILKLSQVIAKATGAVLSVLPFAANEVGSHLVEFLPKDGLNTVQMISKQLPAYINFGIEPEHDCQEGDLALKAMQNADLVINFTAFDTPTQREYADVLLPIATFAETAGTFVNAQGLKQSFKPAATPIGDSKPAWKILRVLGNMLNFEGFDYTHTNQIFAEVNGQAKTVNFAELKTELVNHAPVMPSYRLYGIYSVDVLVRRSPALLATPDAQAVPVTQ